MKMAIYILKRTLLALFVLFVITTACFMLVRMLPMELPPEIGRASCRERVFGDV